MALYAAYGSNLDPEQMALRAPALPAARHRLAGGLAAHLRRRGRRLGGPAGTVVERPEPPGLRRAVRPHAGRRGVAGPLGGRRIGPIRKIRVRVQTLDGDVAAWIYVLDAYEGGLPSARYLGMIADAAEAGGAPDDYVTELRTRPCTSVEGPLRAVA